MRKNRKTEKNITRVPKNEKAKVLLYFQKRFSVFMKDIRGELTQREMAEEISKYTPAGNVISQTSISSYENCETLPSIDTFYAITKYADMSADEVFEYVFKIEK